MSANVISAVLQYTSDSLIFLLTVVLDVCVFIVCVWGWSHYLYKVNHVGTYSKISKLQVHKQEYAYLLSRVKVSSTSVHCQLWLKCKGWINRKLKVQFHEDELSDDLVKNRCVSGKKEQPNHWVNGKDFFIILRQQYTFLKAFLKKMTFDKASTI